MWWDAPLHERRRGRLRKTTGLCVWSLTIVTIGTLIGPVSCSPCNVYLLDGTVTNTSKNRVTSLDQTVVSVSITVVLCRVF